MSNGFSLDLEGISKGICKRFPNGVFGASLGDLEGDLKGIVRGWPMDLQGDH